jgi:hypothetical protein
MCSCFCGLASILAEDIKPRASCTEEVLGYAHISKGLSSVSVLLRASVLLSAVVARLLSSKDHMLFQVIRSFSMFHRVFCLFYTMFHQIILKSSQVLWFIKYVSYISVLYSVPNATLYHSRGRGSLTSFWCGCSFYVGNVSSLFRYMSHCLHYQKLFKIFFISSFISKAYQKNWKNWKNVVANTSTKPRLSQGTQPVF